MTIVLIVVVVVLLIVILVQKELLPAVRSIPLLSYVKREALLTEAEQRFFAVLEQAINGRYRIFCQVRVADVLSASPGMQQRRYAFNRISQKHFDFVLCDPNTFEVVLAIELDDRSHQRVDRVTRDEFLNAACTSAGLPLFRQAVSFSYSVSELESQLDSILLSSSLSPPTMSAGTRSISPVASSLVSLGIKAIVVTFLAAAGVYAVSAMQKAANTGMQSAQEAAQRMGNKARALAAHSTVAASLSRDSRQAKAQRAADVEREQASREIAEQNLQVQKEAAWNRFFTPDPRCDHPDDWKVQVQCGNVYMQKKKEFELKWSSGSL